MADSTLSWGQLRVVFAAYAFIAAASCWVEATNVAIGGLCTGLAAKSKCPSPGPLPLASFNLTAYQGRWFEIGSTANFKLSFEGGLSCVQARYSPLNATERAQSGGATIRVQNSGVPFKGNTVAAPARALATSTTQLCRSLKAWCGVSHLQAVQSMRDAAFRLGNGAKGAGYHPHKTHFWGGRYHSGGQSQSTILEKINVVSSSLAEIENLSESISKHITVLQSDATSIAQTGGVPRVALSRMASVQTDFESIKTKLAAVSKASAHIAQSVTTERAARILSQDELSAYNKIDDGNGAVSRLATEATGIVRDIDATLGQMKVSLNQLIAAAAAAPFNPQAVPTGGRAVAKQDPASTREGQLQVIFPFAGPAPYTVIAIEGTPQRGYTAALVYSCTSGPNAGAPAGEPTMYILSRTPSLNPGIINKFFAFAKRSGVVLSCSNPFIYTPQSPALCKKYF